jgi:4,5-DOPA dioxygenase extradiol
MISEERGRMPVLFVGHGNPMNAIESNEFSRAWEDVGRSLPRPEGILCVSAHWETNGTSVTAVHSPPTIHDFYGFPEELFAIRYNAPGSRDLAIRVQELCHSTPVTLDERRGLDHGAWSVLCRMFPAADVPVVQLSLDRTRTAASHYSVGRELARLRSENILILGSGNIVHNLALLNWQGGAHDWAREFDGRMARMIMKGDHGEIIGLLDRREEIRLAIPTSEHFLPLLYCLALQESEDEVSFFVEGVVMGSLSMRSLLLQSAPSRKIEEL